MTSHRYDENIFDPTKLPDPDFQAPDLIGTVEGWRAWGVPTTTHFGNAPKLFSVSFTRFFWVPRQAMRAECPTCGEDVPGEAHTCGFYSAKNLLHLMSMGYHNYDAERNGMFHVIGQVANWGKVVEGSAGWRAQMSYPVHLYVPFEAWKLAKPLSEAYGVPVQLKNILKSQLEAALEQ